MRHDAYLDVVSALTTAAQKPQASLALLMVQLLDVPSMQARFGFAASALLRHQLHDAFCNAVAARGIVVPMNDNCFAVMIESARNRGHAMLAAEKLLRVAEEVFTDSEFVLKPTLRIGIALLPTQTADPDQLLQYAQLAAAAASRQNVRMHVYDDAAAARVVEGWDLSEAFVTALEQGELSVFYQPKIRTRDGLPAGAEALLRWLRNGQPVAAPDVFVPMAEEIGMIRDTTWYVMSNALRMSTDCGSCPVAVNITPSMLHHREFSDMVTTAIATWNAQPSALTLEVTEGALLVDFDEACKRLTKCRDLGIRISIDDFGTGYSSLSYFKKIPANEVKIDKSFVSGMLKDTADHHLVETIINLARKFKLSTVAEGVEDRATYEALAALQCDYVQGYLFSPAIDADAFARWLAEA